MAFDDQRVKNRLSLVPDVATVRVSVRSSAGQACGATTRPSRYPDADGVEHGARVCDARRVETRRWR